MILRSFVKQGFVSRSAWLRPMASSAAQDEVLFERRGPVGVITLNRPKALNAINNGMVSAMLATVQEWNERADVCCILLKGTGPKAFCAGGDIKACALSVKKGEFAGPLDFFRTEYSLIYQLAVLKKPVVAMLDGITMGGGAGLSMHGAFRIATEKTVFAMPECGIGLFPDVGGSRFLTNLPGELGTYLALTGAQLKGADLKRCGLATHYVQSSDLARVEKALQDLGLRSHAQGAVDQALSPFEAAVDGGSGVFDQLSDINACFRGETVEAIMEALSSHDSELAHGALQSLSRGSPLSQKVTLRMLQRAVDRPLATCLQMDFRIVTRMVCGPSDFWEGVRATLIDRDRKPVWLEPDIRKVTPTLVSEFFEQLSDDQELRLPAAIVQQQKHSARL